MAANYNISQVLREAFGINAPIYTIPEAQQQKAEFSYQGLEEFPEFHKNPELNDNNTPLPLSWMGTPIVFSAIFQGGRYQKYNRTGEIVYIQLEQMRLPAATMFTFRRAKNIERTNLLGSNGTVKEIYGFDDWIIDVRGVCLNEPDKSATQQYKELLEWESVVNSIGIEGFLFNQKEIESVTIADWNDNVVQGQPGTIPFSFQLYSDEPVELQIRQ